MPQILTNSTLDDLSPVHDLDRDQRARLAAGGQIATLSAGKRLSAVQEHPWIGYLLSGQVCLIRGETKELIEAGSRRACEPIFSEQQLLDQAVFTADSELLRLDRQLYDSLSNQRRPAVPSSLDELDLSDAEGVLLGKLYHACKEDKLALPTLPKVARAIQDAMKDPNITSARLARIVQVDLAVTGGLIRLANSVVYRGVKDHPGRAQRHHPARHGGHALGGHESVDAAVVPHQVAADEAPHEGRLEPQCPYLGPELCDRASLSEIQSRAGDAGRAGA
jgi:hypothetical protein